MSSMSGVQISLLEAGSTNLVPRKNPRCKVIQCKSQYLTDVINTGACLTSYIFFTSFHTASVLSGLTAIGADIVFVGSWVSCKKVDSTHVDCDGFSHNKTMLEFAFVVNLLAFFLISGSCITHGILSKRSQLYQNYTSGMCGEVEAVD